MQDTLVNILGQEYKVLFKPAEEKDPKLKNADGYTEPYAKELIVSDFEVESDTVKNVEDYKRKVLRHEIVHAFLWESGLDCESWGRNEEIVDWIAFQLPKIYKACKEVNAL